MKQEVETYNTVTTTPYAREIERLRTKAHHDEAQALRNAKLEGIQLVAKNMLNRNKPVNEIMEDTGLTQKEVENLRNSN